MNRWAVWSGILLAVIAAIGGQFEPHHLPGCYRFIVVALAVAIWLVLMERPRSRDS